VERSKLERPTLQALGWVVGASPDAEDALFLVEADEVSPRGSLYASYATTAPVPTLLPAPSLQRRCAPAGWIGLHRRTRLIIARNRPVLRCGSIRKVEKNFVYITPAPVFRRIVALDDRVRGGVKMFGRMSVRRVIATADVTAGPANPQVNPGRTDP
jgi:hypothetical protein